MKVYRYEDSIELAIPLEEAWAFFANPLNLEKLTPTTMAFENVYPLDAPEVFPGMLIVHRVSPIPFLKLTWVTEITHIAQGVRFVDEQRKGPFAMWHHMHEFEATSRGTIVRDVLYYGLPLGMLGRLAHAIQVKAQIASIFAYRKARLKELFKEVDQ